MSKKVEKNNLSNAEIPLKINELKEATSKGVRLVSLDFYRGFIMILLMIGSVKFYDHINEITGGTNPFVIQFFHHPWHGLRFWDLVQPGFMFIAGVSMSFSLYKQTA